jgi:hypothetical protein
MPGGPCKGKGKIRAGGSMAWSRFVDVNDVNDVNNVKPPGPDPHKQPGTFRTS